MIGRIIKIISNQYTIVDENDNIYQCIAMGKVRLQMTPFVGDKVEVVKFDDKYGIEKIYPRDNFMIRPAVANIDQLIIVMSAMEPCFSETLVDRISFLATHANIKCLLCITKMDLVDDMDEVIEDTEDIIGTEWIDYFKEERQDLVCVRNEKLKCDYEIAADVRKYYGDVVRTDDDMDDEI